MLGMVPILGAQALEVGFPLDGLTPSGAWSGSRVMVDGYAGSLFTETSGDVQTCLDQSGNSNTLSTTTNKFPTTTSYGSNGRIGFDLTTVDGNFTKATLADLIDADDGYFITSVYVDSISNNSATIYDNDGVIADTADYMGVFLRSTNKAIAYNWDGNADYSPDGTGDSVSTGQVYVFEWLHTGGNLTLYIDGVASTSVASGNTGSLIGTFYWGSGTDVRLKGVLFELASFKTIPNASQRTALRNNMSNWVG